MIISKGTFTLDLFSNNYHDDIIISQYDNYSYDFLVNLTNDNLSIDLTGFGIKAFLGTKTNRVLEMPIEILEEELGKVKVTITNDVSTYVGSHYVIFVIYDLLSPSNKIHSRTLDLKVLPKVSV